MAWVRYVTSPVTFWWGGVVARVAIGCPNRSARPVRADGVCRARARRFPAVRAAARIPARTRDEPAIGAAARQPSAGRATPEGPAPRLGQVRGGPRSRATAQGTWAGDPVPGGGRAGAAVRRAGVRGRGAPDAERPARLGPVPPGGRPAGPGTGRAVEPAAHRSRVPAAAHRRRPVLLERLPLGDQRAPLGGGGAAVRGGPGRLPPVSDQSRGGARARPPARVLPRPGPAGPGDDAAVEVAGRLPPESVAVPGEGAHRALM